MEDGGSTVCVERAAIGERDGKLLEQIKRRGGYTTKAMTATTHDFLPSDTLSQAQVSAKLSPREVQA